MVTQHIVSGECGKNHIVQVLMLDLKSAKSDRSHRRTAAVTHQPFTDIRAIVVMDSRIPQIPFCPKPREASLSNTGACTWDRWQADLNNQSNLAFPSKSLSTSSSPMTRLPRLSTAHGSGSQSSHTLRAIFSS